MPPDSGITAPMTGGSPSPRKNGGGISMVSRAVWALWAGISLLVLSLAWFEPFALHRLDYLAQDALSLRRFASDKELQARAAPIKMVLIGERSLKKTGQWPWPRSFHGRLLERLAKAELVIFDMVMPEQSDPQEDARLADAVRKHGRVLAALYAIPTGEGKTPGAESLTPVFPYRELLEACAGVGIVNTIPERDGVVRRSKLLWRAGTLNLPSLPLASAQALTPYRPSFASRDKGLTLHWSLPDHAALPESASGPFPNIPLAADFSIRFAPLLPDAAAVYEYVDVLDGTVDPEEFVGAIVLVGASGAGVTDVHRMAGGRFVPGPWILAQSLVGITSGKVLLPVPALPAFGLGLLFCLGCAAAGFLAPARFGVIIAGLLAAAWLLAWSLSLWFFLSLLPLAAPLLAGLVLFIASAIWRLRRFEREWAVRTLPLDEILTLPHLKAKDLADGATFSRYLESAWSRIKALSGLELISARTVASDPETAALLQAARSSNGFGSDGVCILPHARPQALRHRMLIPLPFPNGPFYCIAAWDRRIPPETLTSVAALVLAVATHFTSLEEQAKRQGMLLSTIRALTGAIDAKDPVTAGHSERVAALGRDIALWLGWSDEAADEVFFAGILHDVGKIGVPDAVLNKPGKLSDEEFAAMKSHPGTGASIMEPIDIAEGVARGILEHHERLDGRGYPNGLSADQISGVARVLKIADVFDALVSKRQYKEPWPLAKACDLLFSQRGTEFDPLMVDVFLKHMAPEGWKPNRD